MKLAASPFDPQNGALLPVYREAYLRGDLALASALAVEHYLGRETDQPHATPFQQLRDEAASTAPGWVGRQLQFIREQPQRIWQRALPLLLSAALLAGATLVASYYPAAARPLPSRSAANMLAHVPVLHETVAAMILMQGRVLNEQGQALAGATVWQKGTHYATSTNAAGEYRLQVPVLAGAALQIGHAGYQEQQLPLLAGTGVVILHSEAAQPHRRLAL